MWIQRRLGVGVQSLLNLRWSCLSPPHAAEEFSIAVLPFINRGNDEESECFTDGLTDELTIALGRIPWLRLTARTSAFRFKGADIDIRRIGRYLNVRVVIEGSVRKYGRRLRIAVQANEAKTGCRLWSEVTTGNWMIRSRFSMKLRLWLRRLSLTVSFLRHIPMWAPASQVQYKCPEGFRVPCGRAKLLQQAYARRFRDRHSLL